MSDVQPRPHRRAMAYVALIVLCVVATGALFRELSQPNVDLLIAVVYGAVAIVAAYMGAQVAPEVFRRS